jgi:hypothetical protein
MSAQLGHVVPAKSPSVVLFDCTCSTIFNTMDDVITSFENGGMRGIQDSPSWCHEVHPGSLDYEAASARYFALDGSGNFGSKDVQSMVNVLRYEECDCVCALPPLTRARVRARHTNKPHHVIHTTPCTTGATSVLLDILSCRSFLRVVCARLEFSVTCNAHANTHIYTHLLA